MADLFKGNLGKRAKVIVQIFFLPQKLSIKQDMFSVQIKIIKSMVIQI